MTIRVVCVCVRKHILFHSSLANKKKTDEKSLDLFGYQPFDLLYGEQREKGSI